MSFTNCIAFRLLNARSEHVKITCKTPNRPAAKAEPKRRGRKPASASEAGGDGQWLAKGWTFTMNLYMPGAIDICKEWAVQKHKTARRP